MTHTHQHQNINCLAGMRCPNCKSHGPFEIYACALFTVHDDGTDDYTDLEWNNGSFCFCPHCQHEGYVFSFTQPG